MVNLVFFCSAVLAEAHWEAGRSFTSPELLTHTCSRLAIGACLSFLVLAPPPARFCLFLENRIVIRSASGAHLHSHPQVALHPATQLSPRLQPAPSGLHTVSDLFSNSFSTPCPCIFRVMYTLIHLPALYSSLVVCFWVLTNPSAILTQTDLRAEEI